MLNIPAAGSDVLFEPLPQFIAVILLDIHLKFGPVRLRQHILDAFYNESGIKVMLPFLRRAFL
ncbi:hypothetical protein D3C73_1454810 [compost metagenome]